ncbi:MAG: hypothetical protein U9Q66_03920 [Patescibacteria group bacterium]|nr:hypothetical protein [Patescibacteria group bacterium]
MAVILYLRVETSKGVPSACLTKFNLYIKYGRLHVQVGESDINSLMIDNLSTGLSSSHIKSNQS